MTYSMRITILIGEDAYRAEAGASTHVDNDGVQWLTFTALNGYHKGLPHVVRTDRILIVAEKAVA